MAYADLTFYKNEYLQGKTAVISDADFPYWSSVASTEINIATFGRIENDISKEVKMCCCEMAECLYRYRQMKINSGILSEKVGEYSVTYADNEKIEISKGTDTRKIINRWLLMTGLLYRGLC